MEIWQMRGEKGNEKVGEEVDCSKVWRCYRSVSGISRFLSLLTGFKSEVVNIDCIAMSRMGPGASSISDIDWRRI